MIKTCLIVTFLLTPLLQAASVSFTKTFDISETYTGVAGSTEVFGNAFLTASLSTFSPALGTLDFFTITWSLEGNFTGTLSAPGGAGTAGYNGEFFTASLNLPAPAPAAGNWAGGGGNGSGGPGGMVLSIPLTAPGNPLSFSQTFSTADAGITYDQQILDAILSSEPLILQWSTPLTISGFFETLSVAASAFVEVAYEYSPVPESSTALLTGSIAMAAFSRRRRAGRGYGGAV